MLPSVYNFKDSGDYMSQVSNLKITGSNEINPSCIIKKSKPVSLCLGRQSKCKDSFVKE